jgi:hypothetical protein
MKIASRAINSSESAITDISENWASKTRARLLAEAENIFGEDPDILFDVKNGINAIEAKHIREIDPNTGREVLTSIMKNPFGEGNLINTTVIDNIEAFKGLKPKTPEWNKALENLTESIIEEKAGKINLNPKINKMELPDGKIAIQGTWQDANGKVISKEHILNPEMQYMKVPTVTKNSADIKQLREMSADLESIISGNQDYRTKKLAMDMKQEVNGQIDKLSNQLEQKARDLQVAKTDIQALLGINLDTNNPLAFKSEFENITTALKNKLIDKFDQESNDVRRRISEAFQKMYDAGFIDQEGFNRLHNELGGRAKIANILKHSHETSNLATNLLNFTKWPQTARGTGYSVAGHSGVVAGSASKLAGEMMQSLSHATPEQLKTLALGLKQAGSPFAPVIENIVNSPMAKRRAVIFTLMQNKDFKSMVSGIADAAIDVEKDNKEK